MSSRSGASEKRPRESSGERVVDAVQHCPNCQSVDITPGKAYFALGCSEGCKICHVCFAETVVEGHSAIEFVCPCCNDGFTSFDAVHGSTRSRAQSYIKETQEKIMLPLPPPAEFSKNPVRYHEEMAENSDAGAKFVGITLTTCQDGHVNVKSSMFNIDQVAMTTANKN